MSRDLSYIQLPKAMAELVEWNEVLENSWDTARWQNNQEGCLVHWEGGTPPTIQNIMKIDPSLTISNHAAEKEEINNTQQDEWDDQPLPPEKP
jgi:hypothetical protein